MAGISAKGNCYLCGRELSKAGFKRHFIASHTAASGDMEDCALIRVEDPYVKCYWLYLDIPLSSTLKSLDTFLRNIWLECCGHMSCFTSGRWNEIAMSRKIGRIAPGTELGYQYDMGSTTELKVTFCEIIKRPIQRNAVRLLARNIAPEMTCRKCGKAADYICLECMYEDYEKSPFYCEACWKKHAKTHEMCLPAVNSPRMGVCGYCGERDIYQFVPKEFEM